MEFKKVEVFADTGEVIEREMTQEEVAEILELRAQEEQKAAEKAARSAEKQSILDRLGITEKEARLLLS